MNDRTTEILETASVIFSKYGYKKTTMQDIGSELGMTKSNLYLYAKNKEDLYIKSVSFRLAKWRDTVERAINEQNAYVDKLEIMCKKSFEYIHNDKVLKDLVEKDPDIFVTNHDNDRFIEINSKAQQLVKNIITQGIEIGEFRNVDVDNIAEYIFSTYMMFLIKLYSKKDQYTTEKLVDDAIDLLKHGLLAN